LASDLEISAGVVGGPRTIRRGSEGGFFWLCEYAEKIVNIFDCPGQEEITFGADAPQTSSTGRKSNPYAVHYAGRSRLSAFTGERMRRNPFPKTGGDAGVSVFAGKCTRSIALGICEHR